MGVWLFVCVAFSIACYGWLDLWCACWFDLWVAFGCLCVFAWFVACLFCGVDVSAWLVASGLGFGLIVDYGLLAAT